MRGSRTGTEQGLTPLGRLVFLLLAGVLFGIAAAIRWESGLFAGVFIVWGSGLLGLLVGCAVNYACNDRR